MLCGKHIFTYVLKMKYSVILPILAGLYGGASDLPTSSQYYEEKDCRLHLSHGKVALDMQLLVKDFTSLSLLKLCSSLQTLEAAAVSKRV